MKTITTGLFILLCTLMQAQNFADSLNAQANIITLCAGDVPGYTDDGAPEFITYMKAAFDSAKVFTTTEAGCQVFLDYQVNCDGDAGNYKLLVDGRKQACKSYYQKVMSILNTVKKIKPATLQGKPTNYGMRVRVTYYSDRGVIIG